MKAEPATSIAYEEAIKLVNKSEEAALSVLESPHIYELSNSWGWKVAHEAIQKYESAALFALKHPEILERIMK